MQSAVTDKNVRHLLRRFGLGASEDEVRFYGADGYEAAVERLIAASDREEPFDNDIAKFANAQGLIQVRAVQIRWLTTMIATRRPLVHAMAVFWHDHFATSATKVAEPMMMLRQVEIFEKGGLGAFPDLLAAVSKDPAMLLWLDNNENRKDAPNENFAREVMELFTLGIGHYSEKDVQEAARAFTGWTFRKRGNGRNVNQPDSSAFVFQKRQHDAGVKTVLGKEGNFDGDQMLNLLCDQPRTAIYIAHKVWEWFAYPNPEPRLIERIATQWRDKRLEVRELVRLVATSPEFLSEMAQRAIVKNPVHFCVSTMRQLGLGRVAQAALEAAGTDQRRPFPGVPASLATKAMGMELLYPPDVAGWEGGTNWISSATMVERIKWADRLFGGRQDRQAGQALMPLFLGATDPDAFARRMAKVFDTELPEAKLDSLAEATRAVAPRGVTAANVRPAALAVAKLLFGAPEFQFC